MSSGEEDIPQETSKKRRLQRPRACDNCRRRKVRCDGGNPDGAASTHPSRCSNCVSSNLQCTYNSATSKRNASKAYVEALEERLQNMEKFLQEVLPGTDVSAKFGGPIIDHGRVPSNSEHSPREPSPSRFPQAMAPSSYEEGNAQSFARSLFTRVIRQIDLDPPVDDLIEDISNLAIVDRMKEIQYTNNRFFGKSSGATLIQAALDLKTEYCEQYTNRKVTVAPKFLKDKRDEYWNTRPWEKFLGAPATDETPFDFPDDAFMADLIDLYFAYCNAYIPLLHRPTFEKAVKDKLHLRDRKFAHIVLLVCAIGSRDSKDPRVLLDNFDTWLSSGWKWFAQVPLVRPNLLGTPSLYDLQFYCLAVHYLVTTSSPQSAWVMVGIGVRLAQDIGAHRKRLFPKHSPAERELYKRAWWILLTMERMISSAMGRPCAVHDEDCDVELPIECDDEYWDTPDPADSFKQPLGKPSYLSAFIWHIKLSKLLSYAQRTVYSNNKAKVLFGFVGTQWEQHLITEIDSALNKWSTSLPDHLRWDPRQPSELFFNQSVFLHGFYYQLQILVHRPYIPVPGKPSRLPFPSLSICTNAARSCANMVEAQKKRNIAPLSFSHAPVFTAGIVLLLNMWSEKRLSNSHSCNGFMDVQKCMDFHRRGEDRWTSAGRYWDILAELASVGDLLVPMTPGSTPSLMQSATASATPSSSSGPESPQPDQQSINQRTGGGDPCAPFSVQFGPMQMDPSKLAPMINPDNPSAWYPQQQAESQPFEQSVFSNYLNEDSSSPGSGAPAQDSTRSFVNGGPAAFSLGRDRENGLDTTPSVFQQGYYQYEGSAGSPSNLRGLNSAMIDMWSQAPTGIELTDWNTYFQTVNQLTQQTMNFDSRTSSGDWRFSS